MMYSILYLVPPKRLKETPTFMRGMNRKPIANNNDINHDDCFANHERCLI